MKNNIFKNNIILTVICALFMSFSNVSAYAQKKQKVRIKAQYTKIGSINLIMVSGKYREHKRYKPAAGLDLKIYQVFDNDSLNLIGAVALNKEGKGQVKIDNAFKNTLDNYNFKVVHKDSKLYKKASKNVSVKVANLKAALTYKNKNPFITATLTDAKNKPIKEVELKVNLQRLFAPLDIGKGSYFTDDIGTISVPIIKKMPGIDGKLIYEVILDDNDDYGTIKTIVKTNIGSVVKDLSTFDQRTMWSPPTKAPLFDLIVPNLIILFVWGFLFILMFNLYRISKYKNA